MVLTKILPKDELKPLDLAKNELYNCIIINLCGVLFMQTFIIVLAIAVLIFCVALLIASWLLFSLACARRIPRIMAPLMDGLIGDFELDEIDMVVEGKAFYNDVPRESWQTTSHDGLTLRAEYIPCDDARGTIMLFHGYRSRSLHDFCGVLPYYHSLGLNILMCDHRAHGKSEGKYITFGVLERRDVMSWIEEHNRRVGPSTPVVLDGISMGGATVAYAADLALPDNVVGIMDDCGYSSPREQIHYVMGLMKIPVFPFYYLADLMARLFARFSFSDVDGRETLSRARVPCMFIHGEADNFVPCRMGQECHDATPTEKKIFICKGAGHGLSYVTETEKCKQLLREYLDSVLR